MSVEDHARAHREAMELARERRWQLAEDACRRLLETRPDRADTLCLLGAIYLQTGRCAQAVEPLRGSIALHGHQPVAHTMLGDALLGVARKAEALLCYQEALRQSAALVPALFGRANALFDLQQFNAARAAYEAVLEHAQDHAEAWFNRGNSLLALRQPELAAESYQCALRIRPDYAAAHNNRGSALSELNQLEAALASFEAAVAADSMLVDAHRNRGATLDKLGRATDALRAFERALSLNAGDLEARHGYSKVLLSLGRYQEASEHAAQVLACSPEHAGALRVHAEALNALLQYDGAARSFAGLLRIGAEFPYVAGALHHAQRWCANWSYLDRSAHPENLRLDVLAGRQVDHPFSFLAVTDDPEAQLCCARTFVEAKHYPSDDLRPLRPYRHKRLRVAYVSGDFRPHAVSYLLAGLFERHDSRRVETIGISLAPVESSTLGRRMQTAFAQFFDVSGRGDLAVAQLIRSLETDIVVDLSGHTSPRLNIFSYRPAPIQVQYLGFPGTLGAPFIDYLLADSFVIPPEEAGHYTERLVYLPDCFQANGDLRTDSTPRPLRRDVGLSEDAFVFCCFNNIYKLTRVVFEVWMRLLTRVPRSVLWLYAPSKIAAHNLRLEAGRCGVNPERLVFAARMPYQAHVARIPLADLFLDTLPFNGGATASDALWSGVPVLTCCGRSFAARMAGSLLQTLGLSELTAGNLETYESKAVELAAQPQLLSAIKARLVDARRSTLFDGAQFCRHLELAYHRMLCRYERDESLESFAVEGAM